MMRLLYDTVKTANFAILPRFSLFGCENLQL